MERISHFPVPYFSEGPTCFSMQTKLEEWKFVRKFVSLSSNLLVFQNPIPTVKVWRSEEEWKFLAGALARVYWAGERLFSY